MASLPFAFSSGSMWILTTVPPKCSRRRHLDAITDPVSVGYGHLARHHEMHLDENGVPSVRGRMAWISMASVALSATRRLIADVSSGSMTSSIRPAMSKQRHSVPEADIVRDDRPAEMPTDGPYPHCEG
ncbi:hypothetical protein [Gluconacetobacter asukensis]